MKKRAVTIIAIIVLICSVAAAVYPIVSDYLNKKYTNSVVVDTNEKVENTSAKELQAARKAAEEYNKTLLPGSQKASTKEEYYATLNVSDNGIMGVLNIPCIDVKLPIYHGTDNSALERGVGHIYGSSLPVGGIDTHAVLSAHSGMTGKRMLTDLDKLVIGDVFSINVLGEQLYYRVDQIKTVLPYEVNDLAIERHKDYATLITCTPYAVNTHRLLVRGERFYPTAEEEEHIVQSTEKKPSTWNQQYLKGTLGGLGCALVIILVYLAIKRRRKKE